MFIFIVNEFLQYIYIISVYYKESQGEQCFKQGWLAATACGGI